jgi:hypothetical protein
MSIFLLAFAIGPFVWGPMSEAFGRVRVMQCANLIFLLFNTVCGFAKTKQQMMAFRSAGLEEAHLKLSAAAFERLIPCGRTRHGDCDLQLDAHKHYTRFRTVMHASAGMR